MNMFSQTQAPADADIRAESNFVGKTLLDSDIYERCKITMAYGGTSKKGALFVHLSLETQDGIEHSENLYVTSQDGKSFSERNGVKSYLPGYNTMRSICLLTTGKELHEQGQDQKVVKIYDYDAKKEVPTEVPVLVELLDQEIDVAILKIKSNKSKLVGDSYVDTNEAREYNEIDKCFRSSDRMTVPEVLAQETEATYFSTWLEKNKGKVRDRFKEVKEAPTASASGPFASNPATTTPTTGGSLFQGKAGA